MNLKSTRLKLRQIVGESSEQRKSSGFNEMQIFPHSKEINARRALVLSKAEH